MIRYGAHSCVSIQIQSKYINGASWDVCAPCSINQGFILGTSSKPEVETTEAGIE